MEVVDPGEAHGRDPLREASETQKKSIIDGVSPEEQNAGDYGEE